MTIGVDRHIVRLEVEMNDSPLVKEGEPSRELIEIAGEDVESDPVRGDCMRQRAASHEGHEKNRAVLVEPSMGKARDATPEQKATGPSSGSSWRREESRMTGVVVKFDIGRLQESRKVILYYDANRLSTSRPPERATRILTFASPAPKE